MPRTRRSICNLSKKYRNVIQPPPSVVEDRLPGRTRSPALIRVNTIYHPATMLKFSNEYSQSRCPQMVMRPNFNISANDNCPFCQVQVAILQHPVRIVLKKYAPLNENTLRKSA